MTHKIFGRTLDPLLRIKEPRGARFDMKRIVKDVLRKSRFGRRLIQLRREKRILSQFDVKDREQLFSHYYETGLWNSEESASGPGSTLEYTENIRREIPLLIERLGIRKILDAPCGDYNWFQSIPRSDDVEYIGGDIVKALVKHNQDVHGNRNTRFVHIDILMDKLPEADLWLCRDCLFHLSNEDVFLAFRNFLNSGMRYLLTSTHTECMENTDIPTGRFRELNLERAPFNLGIPAVAMDDWVEGFPVRKLALWERDQVANALAANKEFQRYASF